MITECIDSWVVCLVAIENKHLDKETTPSTDPWTRFTTPAGIPAWWKSSITLVIVNGTFSEGLMMMVFPAAMQIGRVQKGTMNGKSTYFLNHLVSDNIETIDYIVAAHTERHDRRNNPERFSDSLPEFSPASAVEATWRTVCSTIDINKTIFRGWARIRCCKM